MQVENILVIPATDLPKFNVPFTGVLCNPFIDFVDLLANYKFLPRPEAEQDPNWKQIIPYCIFMNQEDEVLWYLRSSKGGEKRLHEKASIGFGGHVNSSDYEENGYFSVGAYFNGLQREMQEELSFLFHTNGKTEESSLWQKHFELSHLGLINDDSNDVGRVHLGALHCFRLTHPGEACAQSNDAGIKIKGFHAPDRLLSFYSEQLETWSKLVLENWTALGLASTYKGE
jgi:predicted NUDIX family phosphoesterase